MEYRENFKRQTDIAPSVFIFTEGRAMTKGERMDEAMQPILARWAKTRDPAARAQIIEAYLFLPAYIAGKYVLKGHEYDDIYQTGCIGLIKAVDGYRAEGNFFAYAYRCILGEIKHLFRDDKMIKARSETVTVLPVEDMTDFSAVVEDEGIASVGVREAVLYVLSKRTEEERTIIRLILNGMTQHETAEKVGTYQMRVSRIYKAFRADVRRELYEE